jgi:MFS superfamily sulfate permease-like transporter
MLALRRFAPRVPGVFIAVVGATADRRRARASTTAWRWSARSPPACPTSGLPDVSFDDLKTLLPAAVGIAFVAFADTSVLSRSYAGRLHVDVDQNRELGVLGVANVAAGFAQGFPISSSSSRTAVAEDVGAKSQFAGLSGAAVLALLLIFGTGLLHDLPTATLAAIVIVAVLGFIDIAGARRLLRWRRSEFVLAMAAFVGVAVLGVLWGVGIAIALSLLNFIRRAWRPHDAVLGRVDNLKGYHDTERHPEARLVPGLVLYRFDAPLFFANAGMFRERVRALARSDGVRWVVVAAEPVTDIDVTGGEMLGALEEELKAAGVELAFAELKDPCASACAATASRRRSARPHLPHHRRGGRRLPRGDRHGVARLGGPRARR